MAKRKNAPKMTDKELARRVFSKSVRKELKTVLSELDQEKPKRKTVKKG